MNRSDAYGRTPLHLAAAVDYGTMVEYLIENGADVKQSTIIEGKGVLLYSLEELCGPFDSEITSGPIF